MKVHYPLGDNGCVQGKVENLVFPNRDMGKTYKISLAKGEFEVNISYILYPVKVPE